MWRCAVLIVACAAVWSVAAHAQENTPTDTPENTATPVSTETPSRTPTRTPTANEQRILANMEGCPDANPTPPCDLRALTGGGGLKTIIVETKAGTATVLPICRNGTGWLQSDVALGSLSGATCTTTANCLLSTSAWCDHILLRLTACSSCEIMGRLRIDRGQ